MFDVYLLPPGDSSVMRLQPIAFNQIKESLEWPSGEGTATCSAQAAMVPQRDTIMVALTDLDSHKDFWIAADHFLPILNRAYGFPADEVFAIGWIALLDNGDAFVAMQTAQVKRAALTTPDWRQISNEHRLGLFAELGFDED